MGRPSLSRPNRRSLLWSGPLLARSSSSMTPTPSPQWSTSRQSAAFSARSPASATTSARAATQQPTSAPAAAAAAPAAVAAAAAAARVKLGAEGETTEGEDSQDPQVAAVVVDLVV